MSQARGSQRLGLVLSGGGARAAYQVGVLKAISEVWEPRESPFKILTGISAGAINSTFLAARADNFRHGTEELWKLWANLKPESIFRTDSLTLGRNGLGWMTALSMGGFFKNLHACYLLDTSPLRKLLTSAIDYEAIQKHFSTQILEGVSVSATNYGSGISVTFFDGNSDIRPWTRSVRVGKRTQLTAEHVLASSAIPIFFPSVKLEGSFYGDGSLRKATPLSSAVHLGAERVLAIGLRHPRAEKETLELSQVEYRDCPSVASIGGVLLNSLFLDTFDGDVERMERINRTVQHIPTGTKDFKELKNIPLLPLRPTQDLSSLACEHFDQFPFALRHLLRGIGASKEKGWDLLSYLTFDRTYTLPLLELGYSDAKKMEAELRSFLKPARAAA